MTEVSKWIQTDSAPSKGGLRKGEAEIKVGIWMGAA